MERNCDNAWVERLRRGDASAFDEVFAALNARLLGFVERMARDRCVAEDLVEETWMRLVRAAPELRADTNLAAWLYTVARNLFVSHCRARAREQVYTADWLSMWPDMTARGPYEQVAAGELERALERALGELPATYREALLLVGVEGLTPSEAAAVCGIGAEAMRQRLSRARQMLGTRLRAEERGRTDESQRERAHGSAGKIAPARAGR